MDELEIEVDPEGGAIVALVAEEVVNVTTDDGRLARVHLAHNNYLDRIKINIKLKPISLVSYLSLIRDINLESTKNIDKI